MKYAQNVSELIGNTSLLDLSSLAPGTNVRILGKYEATNPGASVKDRIALAMIEAAEKDGSLKEGGTIIEATSGNTGVGLAMLAAARGYHMILVMPESMSIERRKLAIAYGAELVLTPKEGGMSAAVKTAEELHEQIEGSILARQFENPANPDVHYRTTGPEIWEASQGKVDVFLAGVGTGGTISGAGRFLKEQKAKIELVAVEPAESAVLSGNPAGAHKIQGIGPGFIPKNYDSSIINQVVTVKSDDALKMKRVLGEELGLLVGISSGAAVSAAVELAFSGNYKGKTIVLVLPDTGERYLSMTN